MDLCGCTLDIEAPGLRHPKRAMAPHETLYFIRIAEALLQRGANTNIVSKVLKRFSLAHCLAHCLAHSLDMLWLRGGKRRWELQWVGAG